MTTKQLFFALSCLLLSVIAGQSNVAQESPKMQQDSERHKNISRSLWDGRGASISTEALLRDREFRDALSVSDKYYQEILANVQNTVGRVHDKPEYQKAEHEHEEALRVVLGVGENDVMPITPMIVMHKLNEEQLKAFDRSQEAAGRLESMQREFARGSSQRHTAAMEDALSPELKQKIQEAWLVAIGETSMFSPKVFETLNLTPAQKEGMERIKKELEPELEKHLEIYGNNAAKILERVNAALRQPEVQRAIADVGLHTFMRTLQEEPEHKRLLDESYSSSKAFATLFRKRMFEILNDEQRKRLQGLIDNPPPYAQILIQRLRRENWGQYEEGESDQSGRSERTGVSTDIWVPGPDSWRPGDPIPRVPLQERNTRGTFPRSTN